MNELPRIDDLALRTELTQMVVRLLAKSRPARCRATLNLLFSDAMELGRKRRIDNQLRGDADSSIRKIIQIATLLDRKLAESYIKAYAEQSALESDASQDADLLQSQVATALLKVATELVETNASLAVNTASRSLSSGIVPETLTFLATLRRKDPRVANQFFSAALRSCQARQGRDINELLLLYSFVFSPLKVPVVSTRGIGYTNIPGYSDVVRIYPTDTLLAKQYMDAASRILLDPNRYSQENLARLNEGPLGDFYFLSIIEPQLGRYLPGLNQRLSEQRNILINFLKVDARSDAVASVERWRNVPDDASLSGPGNKATVDHLVSRAERAANEKIRDQFYFRAALVAVQDLQQERALDLSSKLAPGYRDQAQQMVRLSLAERKVRKGQFDDAERLIRIDSSLVSRAYIFTLIADSLSKNDPVRAALLLDEVQDLGRKAATHKDKLSILEGVAVVYARTDPARALEMLSEIVKTANKLDNFDGDVSVSQTLEIGGFLFDFSIYTKELSYFDLISRLGTYDFYQTLHKAREIQNPSLRIHSIVVVCETALAT